MSNQVQNKCSVCSHEHVKLLNNEILHGTPCRDIAERFPPLSKSSVQRHAENCLSFDPDKLTRRHRLNQIVDVYKEMERLLGFTRKLIDAAEEWLEAPGDPSRFTLGPRADEVEVIYWEVDLLEDGQGGSQPKQVKKSALLSEMIARVRDESPDLMLQKFQPVKKTDMRQYALDCVKAIDLVLDKFARFEGMYTKERDNAHTVEKAIEAYRLWSEKNPHTTDEQHREAVSIFARGVGISENQLIERAGITFTERDTVQ